MNIEWLARKEFSQTQKEGESAAEEAKRGGAEKFCILCARPTNWTSLTLSLCLDLSEEALTAHESSIILFHVVVAILLSLRQGLVSWAALFLESVVYYTDQQL